MKIAGVDPAMVTAQDHLKWSEWLSKCSNTMISSEMPWMWRTERALTRAFWKKSLYVVRSHLVGAFPGAYVEMAALVADAFFSKWTMLDGVSAMGEGLERIGKDVYKMLRHSSQTIWSSKAL